MGVDAFQIAPQHMQRIAQRRQLYIALLTGTGGDIGSLVEYFLRQQLGTGQLDQIERTAHLMQGFHRLLQQTAVMPLGDEVLQALLGLLHGDEQLVAHQVQRCGSTYHALGLATYISEYDISRRTPASAWSYAPPWPGAGLRIATWRRSRWRCIPSHRRPGGRACSESFPWYRTRQSATWRRSARQFP